MKLTRSHELILKSIGEYLGAAVLCLVILTCVMKLWKAQLRVPFEYGGDALFHGMLIKGMIDHGWYLRNDSLGMPSGMELYDFPVTDNFHLAVLKLLTLFSSDYALVLNIYFLLTFPLTVLTSMYVFRRFNVSYFPALLGSLLYTFVPFHFLRNEHHLFLAGYYMIPLTVLVILWVCLGTSLWQGVINDRTVRLKFGSFNSVFSMIICVIIGSSGVYFPFFSCFLLLVAGISAAVSNKHAGHFLASGILVTIITITVLINLAPSLIYIRQHGDTQVTTRTSVEAEGYGMKIAQLLLPISGHRIRWLAQLKEKYNHGPLVNENDNASLGLIGSIGFLILLGWLVLRPFRQSSLSSDHQALMDHLSVLNITAILLATIGGFGALFALLASPKIRTYNRMSIFIAFFSLAVVSLLLDRFIGRFGQRRTLRIAFQVLLCLLILGAVFDQTGTTENYLPSYPKIKILHDSDVEFVKRIESSVPRGAMIFQLPYVYFPEPGVVNEMQDYSHFRGYLNSKSLRWSYGVVRGRAGDAWQRLITSESVEDFLESLAVAGFDGIYLDREGYADGGTEMESKLSNALGARPLVSNNGKLAFFNITEYRKNSRNQLPAEELRSQQNLALHPLSVRWEKGFSGLEGTGNNSWRWCSSAGELYIDNSSGSERQVILEMSFSTGYQESSNLRIESLAFSEDLKVNASGTSFSKAITIPIGTSVIRFTCDAPRVNAPLDPRILVFRVNKFVLRVVR